MQITTKFSCGDRIWVISDKVIRGPFLIGKVRFEYTAAQDGPDPESMFCNMCRQAEDRDESYMCFETGVGSGYVYKAEDCFGSTDEASAEMQKRMIDPLPKGD